MSEHHWPAGALFSVEPDGPSGLDPGDIYYTNLGNHHFHVLYLDDVFDLSIGDGHDIDALATLGAGDMPPWLDPVPEPSTLILLVVGAAGLLACGRLRSW